MKLKLYLITLILSSTLLAENRTFNQLILDNQIDLKSKSIKSWLRVFNSQEKIEKYGFKLSNAERFIILKGLKAKQRKSKKKYSRRLR
ncbi:MAG: hypothetical protein U9N02_00050 [Campylobacterota bacterium]|nr:hypothetical protein [Campylobacterota bacterium]